MGNLTFSLLLIPSFALAQTASAPSPQPTKKMIVASEDAPAAVGPYSQAVVVDNTLFSAGQIALNPKTGVIVPGGIEAQTKQVFANLDAVLTSAGFSFANVVQVTVYLTNLDDYGSMNAIYSHYFDAAPPARAVAQVSRLPRDALIEISLIAVK